jgi:hypothetical protein
MSEASPDDVLYLSELRYLFQDELGFSRGTWQRYFRKAIEPRLKYMGPHKSPKSAFMLRSEAMEIIDEIKRNGYRNAFRD